jgi:hypothetical protein
MRLRTPCFPVIAGLLACSTGSAGDTLKIENIAGGDNVVVVVDSRTSPDGTKWWCRNDEVLRAQPSGADSTTVELALDNVPAAIGCNSEIVVFAEGNAMALSYTAWTDSASDIRTITMQPIIDVPVSVWIADAAAAEGAPSEMANATDIYRKNKVGVQFVPTYHDVSSDAKAVATIGNSCDAIGRIRTSAWYTPNTGSTTAIRS